jgi:5-methylthioribose kinase
MSSLDIEKKADAIHVLTARGFIKPGQKVDVKVLAGGVSNRTILVTDGKGKDLVVKQALEKLRVKADWFSDPIRIHREALGLRLLEKILPQGASTPFVFEDHELHLLGMEAVPQPHENWKEMLLAGKIEVDHFIQFAMILARLHRFGSENKSKLDSILFDTSFFENLRLEPYYEYAASQVPQAASFLKKLIETTRKNAITLVHGDFSPKNILVHKGQLVLLDHEVIHFGDGAFDLGFSFAHFLSKARHLPQYREKLIAGALEYWKVYSGEVKGMSWFDGFEARVVGHSLGCLLARVAGRSTLEYLNEKERESQRQQVLKMIENLPPSVDDLIQTFPR